MPNTNDAALVSSHLAGDPAALAGIYDRYADTLYDTAAAMLRNRDDAADVLQDTILIAAERLGQLRDPDRLKPWLFAILRNEVYRRTKKRKRTVATDFGGGEDGFDMADEQQVGTEDAVADAMAGDEFASMLRGAAGGLDERDQLVLELSVRQGLDGQDLADALGVSANQSYTLVHRMRERIERSLGAYAIAKAGRRDCDDLDSILARWDGEFTVLIRKRVARHIDACTTCSSNRTKVAPLALFAGAPALAAPADLRDRILAKAGGVVPQHDYGFTATDGFPDALRAARRIAAWIPATAAASIVLVAATIGLLLVDSGESGELLQSGASTTTIAGAATPTTESPTTTTLSAPTTSVPAVPAADEPASSSTTTSPTTTEPSADTTTTAPTTTTPPATTPTTTPSVTAPPTTAPPVVAPPPPPPPPPTTTSPPATTTTEPTRPGQLSLSAALIDLGASSSAGTTMLTNVGDFAISFQVTGTSAPFTVSPTGGVLGPGQSVALSAAITRRALPEGDLSVTVQVSGDGTSRGLTMRASVDRPPSIGAVSGPQSDCVIFSASKQLFIAVNAPITDETTPISATFSVAGPGGLSASVPMSFDSGRYYGLAVFNLGPNDSASGNWSWSMSATDGRGNATNTGGSHTVTSC